MPDAEPQPTRPIDREEIRFQSQDTLRAILDNRPAIISLLSAILDDLNQTGTKTQLRKLLDHLQNAKTVEELQSNHEMMQWLPILASGFGDGRSAYDFSNLIVYASKDHEIRTERKRALAYPAMLAAGVALVFSLLTILVVPIFEKMFEDYGIQLPGATQFVIALSREVRFHPVRLLSAVLTGIVIFITFAKIWHHTGLAHRIFKFAVNGSSASVGDMSLLTSRLAELLRLGIARDEALTVASHALKSPWYQRACRKLSSEMRSNQLWYEGRSAKEFPANMILALKTEPTPNTALLRELSAIYADRVHHRMDWATGAFAQLAVVTLGCVVGFMVVVLLTPLFSLISALS
jgi:type IV pilus assembly protein PilC